MTTEASPTPADQTSWAPQFLRIICDVVLRAVYWLFTAPAPVLHLIYSSYFIHNSV